MYRHQLETKLPLINISCFCLSVFRYVECSPLACPCKERCTNQRFQQRQYVRDGLTRFQTTRKGYGIKTKIRLEAGVRGDYCCFAIYLNFSSENALAILV